jgi:hypothetical protein
MAQALVVLVWVEVFEMKEGLQYVIVHFQSPHRRRKLGVATCCCELLFSISHDSRPSVSSLTKENLESEMQRVSPLECDVLKCMQLWSMYNKSSVEYCGGVTVVGKVCSGARLPQCRPRWLPTRRRAS